MPNSASATPSLSNSSAAPMTQLVQPHAKFTISQIGLSVREVLSFDEWAALAPTIGSAVRSVQFVLGDWLVYGEEHFTQPSSRVPEGRYEAACAATGIDYGTLRNYASVSRKVRLSLRNDKLSWEHHRIVSPLPPEEQTHWLTIVANSEEKIGTRRLRASISSGRLVTGEELAPAPSEQGVANHIVPINRLSAWWNTAGGERWLGSRSVDQLESLLRDFAPIARMIEAIESRLASRTGSNRQAA